MSDSYESESDLDLATSRRLRRLAAKPVDLADLQARIAADIPRPEEVERRKILFRPMLAAAASVAVLVAVATALFLMSPAPVLASTETLSNLYDHNATMLMDGSAENPMPCCVRQVEGKNVTCVALDVAGKRVMMTVGDGKHFKIPESAGRRVVDGFEYRYQQSGSVNMVMAVRDGAWICLMGEPTVDELIARFASLGHQTR